jgi:flagellar basal body-associated protein FliL
MDSNISTQPTQPIPAEMPAQQSLPPKKSNKKIVFWIFAILLFLIAFVVGGFFTGAKQNKPILQNQQKQTAPIPNPTTN